MWGVCSTGGVHAGAVSAVSTTHAPVVAGGHHCFDTTGKEPWGCLTLRCRRPGQQSGRHRAAVTSAAVKAAIVQHVIELVALRKQIARRNQDIVKNCVRELEKMAAHHREVQNTMRVTWMVQITTSGLDQVSYFRSSAINEYASRVDRDKVHNHYEALILAGVCGLDVCDYIHHCVLQFQDTTESWKLLH